MKPWMVMTSQHYSWDYHYAYWIGNPTDQLHLLDKQAGKDAMTYCFQDKGPPGLLPTIS